MKQFDVLQRSLDLKRSYLLEASAGTGKTFSIQHLVVRLLAESPDASERLILPQILVVTFTREAVRNLKKRIRMNIEEAIRILDGNCHEGNVPEYLNAILEQGPQQIDQVRKRLRQALFLFEQAQIFTIHSFCSRMLKQFSMESDTGFNCSTGEDPRPEWEMLQIVRDFFRTELLPEKYSAHLLEQYLRIDPDQKKLLSIIQSTHGLESPSPFEEHVMRFSSIMAKLKQDYGIRADKLMHDFTSQASSYKNYSSETKGATSAKITRFANLFDQESWSRSDLEMVMADGFVWSKALDPALLKKRAAISKDLHYPGLTEEFNATLNPLIEEAANVLHLFASLACECRQFLQRVQDEEEQYSPDDILKKMSDALEHPQFIREVRSCYKAVIVDEFQDTDPIQWKIFSRLFPPQDVSWDGHLYLVGDPKQSIYSFRQADIYTYLDAFRTIGQENCFSLSVNYRSQGYLVEALNVLFAKESLPCLFPLPKYRSSLDCQVVQPAKEGSLLDDMRKAVHFVIADCKGSRKSVQAMEQDVFIPFISSEIIRLNSEYKLPFHSFAVLVRDRYQALRLAEYFEEKNIPFLNQRGIGLGSSMALQALFDLINALLNPSVWGKIVSAMGSPLFGWTYADLKDPDSVDFIYSLIHQLRQSFLEKEFFLFLQDLFSSPSRRDGMPIREQLLSRNEGLFFYRDLLQIADCVSEEKGKEWNHPEGILTFLNQVSVWEMKGDVRIKRLEDPSSEGVRIMTLHMSKGLEFDVVFALGLINRDTRKEMLIPVEEHGRTVLKSISEESPLYQRHCEEKDAEKMRQLYVSLTRAKHLLYIPASLHLPSTGIKSGEASPIELFTARLNRPPASYQDLYERIRQEEDALIPFLDKVGLQHYMTYSLHEKVVCSVQAILPSSSADLKEPPVVKVNGEKLWMSSFTTLSHHLHPDPSDRYASASAFPKDYNSLVKNVHTLPANSDTGLLIHRILEKISLHEMRFISQPEQLVSFVRPFIQNHPCREWEEVIAEMVFNSIKTILDPKEFSLSQLENGCYYREMPFLFPHHHEMKIEGLNFFDGMIKGVVDLLCYHQNRYYLLDWKTNWLGPDSGSYQSCDLNGSMEENFYYYQAAIYAEAVKRFLRIIDVRPFEECFGGIFYLFLRGMEPGKSTGILYFEHKDLDIAPKKIRNRHLSDGCKSKTVRCL